MAVKARTWIWIIVGVIAVGILCVIAMAGAGMYFVAQNVQARTVSSDTAAGEFDTIRKLFAGQKALIELDERGNFLRSNTDRPAPPNPTRPQKLYVLAFDPDDGRLVRMSVPFWLLRMKTNDARIDFSGNRVDLEDLKLTVEDLEKFGPSLILDQRNEGGDRILVWSQ
jgi:hypothetical protein